MTITKFFWLWASLYLALQFVFRVVSIFSEAQFTNDDSLLLVLCGVTLTFAVREAFRA